MKPYYIREQGKKKCVGIVVEPTTFLSRVLGDVVYKALRKSIERSIKTIGM